MIPPLWLRRLHPDRLFGDRLAAIYVAVFFWSVTGLSAITRRNRKR